MFKGIQSHLIKNNNQKNYQYNVFKNPAQTKNLS